MFCNKCRDGCYRGEIVEECYFHGGLQKVVCPNCNEDEIEDQELHELMYSSEESV